ncbi:MULTISPECIES: hypothetical protein [unclassified Frankia]|uniref:hypothetical protein n=1 Tax=unclassified Frankia TaxID=2632575 RepID=UPI001EF4EDC3|nr:MULTISPECIES: hypothetical protein [unclassified Frankia]
MTTGATLGLLFLLGGCGGSTPAVPPPSVSAAGASSVAALPADLPTDLPTDLDVARPAVPTATASAAASAKTGLAALQGTAVPKHFPFPKGATPTVLASEGTGVTLALSGVTGDAAIRYYRQAMPAAGYTFQQQIKSDSSMELIFTGYNQNVRISSDAAAGAQSVTLVFGPQ